MISRSTINKKYRIAASLSLVIAVFFSLPWLTLIDKTSLGGEEAPILSRVSFMFATVFIASMILFHYNLFSKHHVLTSWTSRNRTVITTTINLLLVLAISIVIFIVADAIFTLKAPKAYFLVYLTRNSTIALVVILVTYVIELVDKLRLEKIEVLTLKQKNTEAELAMLKGQIDPHFLFNTLTTLSSLARSNNTETIRFIDHMADTFRYMLDARDQNVVTVKDELTFLESYLFMMKRRFEEGLHVDINIHQDLLDRPIPQFALQTLVENAIKHNIVSIKQTLRIEIRSNEHSIIVRNNLNEKKFTSGYGIGLNNLAQRYWLMAKKEISIYKSDTSFEVSLPVL